MEQLRVAIYCRISDDREGERLGVERQREDCLTRAEREGWDVVEVFEDNDISASTKSRKLRPSYVRMIAAAEASKIDVILSYSNSRLTRRLRELEDLIRLYERTGVRLMTVVSGDDNLGTADGRMIARIKASVDAAEAERTGERVTRAARGRAEKGLWHGGTPAYGYLAAAGEKGALIVDPVRAEVVKDVAQRLLAGASLYSVCMTLNRNGVKTGPSTRTPEGSRWHARTLKRVVTCPAVAGLSTQVDADGEYLKGKWDPILDRKTWDTLCEILNDEDRATRQSWLPAHKYALSGLLVCGRDGCGKNLTSNTARRPGDTGRQRVSYICSPATSGCGKIRINGSALEEFVVRQMLALLDIPAVRTALSTREELGDDDELRQSIRDDERRLQRVEDEYFDEKIDRPGYLRQRARITDRLTASRRSLAALHRETFLVELGGRTLRQAWDEHADDLGWRRTLLRHVIERIVVLPHPVGVASTLPARKSESSGSVTARRHAHLDLVLLQRVRIEWKAERLPDDAPDIDRAAFDHLSQAEKLALWTSRMHAGRPVQVTDPSVVGDVAGLVRSSGVERSSKINPS